jgi:hypothetical protein
VVRFGDRLVPSLPGLYVVDDRGELTFDPADDRLDAPARCESAAR